MLELTQENIIIDLPGLHRFRIGDKVVADECASHDRHEGVVVGIEMQRLHGSGYLVPSITLLHGGYLTDGFKPDDLRHLDPAPEPQMTVAEAAKRYLAAIDSGPESDIWDTWDGKPAKGATKTASDASWAEHGQKIEARLSELRAALTAEGQP